jgi:hypothetical protein
LLALFFLTPPTGFFFATPPVFLAAVPLDARRPDIVCVAGRRRARFGKDVFLQKFWERSKELVGWRFGCD